MTDVQFDEIGYDDCLELLRFGELGRVAVVIDGFPVIVPVNYRLVEGPGGVWIALRTRSGNVVDRDRAPVWCSSPAGPTARSSRSRSG